MEKGITITIDSDEVQDKIKRVGLEKTIEDAKYSIEQGIRHIYEKISLD